MQQETAEHVERSTSGPSAPAVLSVNQNLEIQRNESQCHQDTDARASVRRRCTQPVDESCVLEFFACQQILEDKEKHRSVLDVSFNTSTSLQATRSYECGAHEGIPHCLGARLSRRLPGDPDFFQINTNDLHASADADARLSQIVELLKKPADVRIMPASSETTGGDERKTPAAQSTPGSRGDKNAQQRCFEGLFEPFLRHACGHSGSTLDQHYANMQSRFYREDAYRIFISDRIFTAGLTSTWIRVMGLICGLCLVAEFGSSVFTENRRGSATAVLHAHQRQGSYRGRFIRFTTLAVRDSSIVQISSSGLSTFGVMLDGCILGNSRFDTGAAISRNVSQTSSSITLEFSDVVEFDGWFLVTGKGDTALDPAIFVIHTSDDSLVWRRVSSSLSSDQCGSRKNMSTDIDIISGDQKNRLEVTRDREARMQFELVSWKCMFPLLLISYAHLIEGMVSCTTVVIAFGKWSWVMKVTDLGSIRTRSIDSRMRFPVRFFCAFKFVLDIFRIAALILLTSNDSLQLLPYRNNAILKLYSPATLLLECLRSLFVWPVPLLFSERHGLERYGLAGLLSTLIFFSSSSWDWRGPAMIVVAILLFRVRMVRRYQQSKAVAEDRAEFNYLWERIATSESDFQQAVVKLKSLSDAFSLSDTGGLLTASKREIKMKALLHDVVRENICTQQQDGIVLDTDVHEEQMARALISSKSPVMSLDQLYAQAIVMQPFFRSKVEKIALGCNAQFLVLPNVDNQSGDPCTTFATIQPWANFKSYAEAALSQGVQWDGLKHVDRAMYNLALFHTGDVSKLTDIVRQKMLFKTLGDLCTCLECITQDEEIEIVSIKNGYDPQSDAADSVGFRDVLVSLRIVSKATFFFRLTEFVCEIQLCHIDLFSRLTAACHARLLSYKDTMRTTCRADVVLNFGSLTRPWKFFPSPKVAPTCTSSRLSSIRSAANDCRSVDKDDRSQLARSDSGQGQSSTIVENHRMNTVSKLLIEAGAASTLSVPSYTNLIDGTVSSTSVQLPLSMRNRVFQVLRFRCEHPGGVLQARMKSWSEAVKHADLTMVMFTRPIGSLSKRPGQVMMTVIAVYLFYLFTLFMVQGSSANDNPSSAYGLGRNVYSLRHARLTVFETRVPERLKTGKRVGISSLDLLFDDCKVGSEAGEQEEREGGVQSSGDSTTEYITFPHIVKANGWMMKTRLEEGTQPRDPRRFILHFSLPTSSNSTLDDCLLSNDWLPDTTGRGVMKLTNAQKREIVIRELRMRGEDWCSEQACENMTDEKFVLECIPPHRLGDEEWIAVSASVCRFATTTASIRATSSVNTCFPRPSEPFEVGTARGVTQVFQMRAPWFFMAANSFTYLMLGIGFLLSVLFGLLGFVKETHLTMSLVWLVPGFVQVMCGFAFVFNSNKVPSDLDNSFFWLVWGFTLVCTGLVMLFKQDYLMTLPPMAFVTTFISLNVNNFLIVKELPLELPAGTTFFMVLWVWFFAHRQWLIWRSNRTIELDKRTYGGVWDSITSKPSGQQDLADLSCMIEEVIRSSPETGLHRRHEKERTCLLQSLVTLFSSTGPGKHPTQINVEHEIENWPFVPCRQLTRSIMLDSIDQLYMQAVILEPLFLEKITKLAATANGFFLTKISNNAQSMSWAERTDLFFQSSAHTFTNSKKLVRQEESAFVQAKDFDFTEASHLKNVDRAIEKIVRSYKDRISFACDVVRQVVVFDTIPDITLMIGALHNDPEFQVIRVKNRMATAYDSSRTCGYRDVLVNLCLQNNITRYFNINMHICELQLVLKEVVEVRTMNGHTRYVAFRNMRCE